MEDERKAFDEINDMLGNTDYPIRIESITDIEDFLLDDDNRRFEEYAVIGRLYDDLRGRREIDRYPDVSIDKQEEQHGGKRFQT